MDWRRVFDGAEVYEEWLERQPVCSECQQNIYTEKYYNINGVILCPKCLEQFEEYTDMFE